MTDNKVLRVGVVGCGAISTIYFENIARLRNLRLAAVADLDPERAQAAGEKWGAEHVLSTDELVTSEHVDIVLNLTIPAAHADVNLKAISGGKHVYCEKPLAVELYDGKAIIEEAERAGLAVGCAPDTFFGAGIQTCRRLLDEGAIGKPVGCFAAMMSPGVETWHPNPSFYYQVGGGPLFDMGPYYLTALINLLGPLSGVAGLATKGKEQRLITSQPFAGTVVDVETPTHINALLQFESGVIGTMLMSFDTIGSTLPRIEIYGTEGALLVPDPNTYGGPVRLKKAGEPDWTDIPIELPFGDNWRAIGLAEMADAIVAGRTPRASGQMALHALEAMHGILAAAASKSMTTLSHPVSSPAPVDTAVHALAMEPEA